MDINEIYKLIDSRLSKPKKKFSEFVKPTEYNFLSEFIHKESKTRTSQSIVDELSEFNGSKISIHFVWSINARVKGMLQDLQPVKKDVKYCRRCKTKEVPPENFLFCRDCDADNKKKSCDYIY